jgi:hypothetical protein
MAQALPLIPHWPHFFSNALIDGDLFFTVLVPQGENPVLQLLLYINGLYDYQQHMDQRQHMETSIMDSLPRQ